MINGSLDQFLDTGWYSEATIYYNGYIYWLEGYTKPEIHMHFFFIDRWRALLNDDMHYCEYRLNNRLVDYKRIYEISANDMDILKRRFLEAPVFDGKTFWEIEDNLIWADEDEPIEIESFSEIDCK